MNSRMQVKTAKKPAIPEMGNVSVEKHYSVSELAQMWRLSEKTIRRMFEDEPGVIIWGMSEGRFKRRYRTLRIPESVVVRVHRQLRAAG